MVTLISDSPSSTPSNTKRVPGRSGKSGLSTVGTKLPGSKRGERLGCSVKEALESVFGWPASGPAAEGCVGWLSQLQSHGSVRARAKARGFIKSLLESSRFLLGTFQRSARDGYHQSVTGIPPTFSSPA